MLGEFKQKLKGLFREIDMFKVSATLRSNGQSDTSRLCSGVFSLVLIGFLSYIFIAQLVQLFGYQMITSTEILESQQDYSKPEARGIIFSVAPTLENYSIWSNKFQIEAYLVNQQENGQKTQLPLQLEVCRPEMWQNFKQTFTQFQFINKMCPKDPEKLKIKGSNIRSDISYVLVQIKRCNVIKNPACVNDSTFYNSFVDLYHNNLNFGVFYIPDLAINADLYDSFEDFIPLNYHLPFTTKLRQRLSLYLGTHLVQTDVSMAPLINVPRTQTGKYIAKKVEQNVNMERQMKYNSRQLYGEVFIYMSNINRVYTRQIGKIDDVLSYAGGLFGLVIALFSYCVFTYNKYSYQLQVAETAFIHDAHGQKIRQRHFNFLKYLKYQIFSWTKLVFCCQLNWVDCKKIEESRNQANMYLDVGSLFRRMQIFQLLLSYIVDPKKCLLILLTEPDTLDKVKQKRLMIEYYEYIMGEDVAIKTYDVRNKNQSWLLYNKVKEAKDKPKNKKATIQQMPIEQKNQKLQILKHHIQTILKQNLLVSDRLFLQQICEFPEIFENAQKIEVNSQMEGIQNAFAEAFQALRPDKRLNMLEKIPYKIIHRIATAISRKNANSGNLN